MGYTGMNRRLGTAEYCTVCLDPARRTQRVPGREEDESREYIIEVYSNRLNSDHVSQTIEALITAITSLGYSN
jgi:hypothetical protein